MKKRYYISFFLIVILVITSLCFILWYKNLQKHPSKDMNVEPEKIIAKQAQQADITTDCDTVWCIQKYNKQSKKIYTEKVKIPAQYIGVTRKELMEMLKEYQNAPTLKDEEEGFVSQSIVSFSKDRVIILKTYETKAEEGFYLIAEEDNVFVYYGDAKTLYFKTGISWKELPADVQAQIKYGKFVANEKELYSFLESYTS